MTTRVTQKFSMDTQALTLSELGAFLDTIHAAGAPPDTKIRLTEHRGNQRDPTYWTISADVPLGPPTSTAHRVRRTV